MNLKDVPGYEGKYLVSENGDVYSLLTNKFLKPYTNKLGYKFIVLCNNGVNKTCNIHRLVGLAFIPNPNHYPCINHIDGNPSNNNINNLEWCTHAYNVAYRRVTGTNNAKWIKCLETGQIFPGGATEAAKVNNGYKQRIRISAMSNGRYSDKGYHYVYMGGENYEPVQ